MYGGRSCIETLKTMHCRSFVRFTDSLFPHGIPSSVGGAASVEYLIGGRRSGEDRSVPTALGGDFYGLEQGHKRETETRRLVVWVRNSLEERARGSAV